MATRKKATTKKETATPKSGSGNTRGGGLIKVGALWLKTGKNGKFMSGTLKFNEDDNETRILVFKNGYKEEDRHPDYVIYVPGESEGQPRRGGPITDDDIPF